MTLRTSVGGAALEPDRGGIAAVLGVAVLVRAAASWPTGKFPADPDALLTGMRALDILEGRLAVFHTPVRLGCAESYLHLPFVALLGPTRLAVTFAPLFEGVLAVFCVWALARRTLPRPAALLAALLCAAPAAGFLAVTRLPTGYATVLATGAATLALAALWAERPRALTAAALGLAAGLGLWTSIQTLSGTAAAGIWLLLGARSLPLRRLPGPAGAGFVAGALPWLAYNATHGFAPLRDNYGTTPTHGIPAAFANLGYALTGGFADLAGGSVPDGTPLLSLAVVALHALAVALFLAAGLRGTYPRTWALPALAALLSVVFFSVSSAGERHEATARLFVLCYPLVALATGALVGRLARRTSAGGALLALGIVVVHVAGAEMPWSRTRAVRRQAALDDARVLGFLEEHGVGAIVGDYWSVYSFNYLSGGRIRAISADPVADYLATGDRLPETGVKWALVGDEPGVVERWAARSGPRGASSRVGRYTVLLPDPNPPAASSREFQRRLQVSFLLPERIVTSYPKDSP